MTAVPPTLEAVLLAKRQNLLTDYGLTEKPTMVWQAAPVGLASARREQIVNTDFFDDDERPYSSEGWWQSFKTNRGGISVFDGWSSMDYLDRGASWVVEVHHDGHLLVAYWDFENRLPRQPASNLLVPVLFEGAFLDFGHLAKGLYPRIQYAGAIGMTCSLTRAQLVSFGNHRGEVVRPPSLRSELNWPVRIAAGVHDIGTTVGEMRQQFVRACGGRG